MIAKDHLSDRVFFFERSSPINLTVYAYKLNNYEYENTFFEKKRCNFFFTLLKAFLLQILYFFINLCLFVCLGFIIPLENFSLMPRRHHYLWRAVNSDLCSALMAIEQWMFFGVPHLLWHGKSVYNGHLRGPVTLTSIAERLAEELSLPVFTTSVCRGWDSNAKPSECEANAISFHSTIHKVHND